MAPVDLLTATAASIQPLLADGSTSTEELVDAYLTHIVKHNFHGMRLQAVHAIAPPELVNSAALLDRERASSGARGPLHGIPVIVSDLHADRGHGLNSIPLNNSSLEVVHSKSGRDTAALERLLQAGAFIIGKANKANLKMWASTRNNMGRWPMSSQEIQCPYVRGGNRPHGANQFFEFTNPWGTSDGAAVAVAAGFCTVAIGDEARGSLIGPAIANALYALKPTSDAYHPTPSALTRCARDLVDLTAVLTGTTFDEDALNAGWAGLKVGVLTVDTPPSSSSQDGDNGNSTSNNSNGNNETARRIWEIVHHKFAACLERITADGANLVHDVRLPDFDDADNNPLRPLVVDESTFHAYPPLEWKHQHLLLSGKDMEAIKKASNSRSSRKHELAQAQLAAHLARARRPIRNPNASEMATTDGDGGESLNNITSGIKKEPTRNANSDSPNDSNGDVPPANETATIVDGLFASLGLDVLVSPDADPRLAALATAAGLPVLALPVCGTDAELDGSRVGVALLARAGQDEMLLRIAMAWDKAFPDAHSPPRTLVNWDAWVAGTGTL